MLELRVLTATDEHAYPSSGGLLSAADVEATETVSDGEVRLGGVRLRVGGTFLGGRGRATLPEVSVPPRIASGAAGGGYRAVLRRLVEGVPAGVILDGVVPRGDITYDRSIDQWGVPLVAAAADDLWARLEKVRLGELRAATVTGLPFLTLGTYERKAEGGGERYLQGPQRRWYPLRALVRAVLLEATHHGTGAVHLEGQVPEVRYVYRLRSATPGGPDTVVERLATPVVCSLALYDAARGYDRTSLTLPDWTGKQLVEAALAAYGWRLAVRYAPYPSLDLAVSVVPDRWPEPEPAGLPELGGREARGGWTEGLSRVGGLGGFAVRMAGPLRRSSPPVRMPRQHVTGRPAGSVPFLPGEVPSPPPPEAVVAADDWRFEEAQGRRSAGAGGGDPVPAVERAVSVPFTVPDIVVTQGVLNPFAAENTFAGLPVLEAGAVYLAEPHGGRLLHHTLIIYPPGGQRAMVNPAWAGGLYRQRSLSRQPLDALSGDVYLHDVGGVRVGEPAAGVRVGGVAYALRERRLRLSDGRAAVELVRPAAGPDGAPLAPPAASGPARVGAVEGLRARIDQVWVDAQREDYVVVEWEPPALERSAVLYYEVGLVDGRPVGPPPETPPAALSRRHATAFVHLRQGHGGEVDVWVRPVASMIPYVTGPWARITGLRSA